MRVDFKSGYMNNIMLVSNQSKEVRRAVGPNDAHWADVMGYENDTSTSVQLDIRH